MKLLIIEDEKKISEPLKEALVDNGYIVDCVEDGLSGFELAKNSSYDCIILDLNLPGMDGIEVAKKLRDESNTTPILMLTARIGQEKIIEGFESGADDYMIKPFHFKELLLRIQALIKRNSLNKANWLEIGKIKIDSIRRKVFIGEKEIKLNTKEFGILEYLLRNAGRPVSQEEILEHVWGDEIDFFTQTVRTNIKTLRKKIDPEKKFLKTIKGSGYLIE